MKARFVYKSVNPKKRKEHLTGTFGILDKVKKRFFPNVPECFLEDFIKNPRSEPKKWGSLAAIDYGFKL